MVDFCVLTAITFLFSVRFFKVSELLAITGSLVSILAVFHLFIMQSIYFKGYSKIYQTRLNTEFFSDWKNRKVVPKSFSAKIINFIIAVWEDSVFC